MRSRIEGLQGEEVKGEEEGEEELLPRDLAVRGSVTSGLQRRSITWMNAWGA